nr:glycoside hydrolase N-terminal domain-containing protein [Streptomyces hawaiiensis]
MSTSAPAATSMQAGSWATQGADAEAFQPVGELELEFVGSAADAATYRRSLDLRDGVARVERTAAGHLLRQEGARLRRAPGDRGAAGDR